MNFVNTLASFCDNICRYIGLVAYEEWFNIKYQVYASDQVRHGKEASGVHSPQEVKYNNLFELV